MRTQREKTCCCFSHLRDAIVVSVSVLTAKYTNNLLSLTLRVPSDFVDPARSTWSHRLYRFFDWSQPEYWIRPTEAVPDESGEVKDREPTSDDVSKEGLPFGPGKTVQLKLTALPSKTRADSHKHKVAAALAISPFDKLLNCTRKRDIDHF